MARYTDSVCRQCRREGTKLFLKGDRCYNEAKCAVMKRHTPPGQHGQARARKASEYGTQLREKQKCRRAYGVLESQFRKYYDMATNMQGVTGEICCACLSVALTMLFIASVSAQAVHRLASGSPMVTSSLTAIRLTSPLTS